MKYSEACEWLQLDPASEIDDAALRQAFRAGILREHPDKSRHGAAEATSRFQQFSTAHEYLIKCVARGKTGPNAPGEGGENDDGLDDGDDDDDYMYEDGDDDDDDDFFMRPMFSVSFGPNGEVYIRVHFGGGGQRGGGGGGFPGFSSGPRGSGLRSSGSSSSGPFSRSSSFTSQSQQQPIHRTPQQEAEYNDYLRKKREQEEREYEESMKRMYEYQKQKEAERQRQKQKEQERQAYMKERARQAEAEGRDFFESWSRQQCMGEARRRGLNIKGKQHEQIVEILISDEAAKKTRRELKQKAPLLDEWAEVVGTKHEELNKRKVRVTDFYEDMYVVEWDPNKGGTSKKSSQAKRGGGGSTNSRKARIKPEHLRLWGSSSAVPPKTTTTTTTTENDPTSKETSTTSTSTTTSGNSSVNVNGAAASKVPEPATNESNKESVPNNSDADTAEAPPPPHQASSSTAAKMVKIKIKCPKDKKPGDMFEVKNPHAHGAKVMVKVPKGTQPGKFFVWMVRAAESIKVEAVVKKCSVCSKVLSGDETATNNNNDTSTDAAATIAISLRSCPHLVCSACLPLVDGKSCLQCSKPRPTTESLKHLPYVQELQAPVKVLDELLEEYFCRRQSEQAEVAAGDNITDNVIKLKELHEQASETATKAVKKHYRVTSLKVHPDRHGEEFRAQFDTLTKARDVLIDPKLRSSYLDQMLEIVCKVDLSYLPRGHKTWMESNDPDAVEQAKFKKDEPGKKEKQLRIDGGLLYNRPKHPCVRILNNEERLIVVGLPVAHEFQFLQYCREAIIVGSCGDMEEEEIRLGQVSRENLHHVVDGELSVKLYLPKHSLWDISWYTRVDEGDGKLRDTPYSSGARVDVRSHKQIAAQENLKRCNEMAQRRADGIKVTLRNHKGLGSPQGRDAIESRYWALHSEISKGRSVAIRLRAILQNSGEFSTPELTALNEVLDEATSEKVKLEKACDGYHKRDALRSFKVMVAEILESGKGLNWIASVTREELESVGSEPNRLYQLLIESKKANSLMMDGQMLLATSERTDLFSQKQCITLKARGEEAEEQSSAEANRVMAEVKKREEEEKKRLEMEEMASLMPRGTLVRICGLTAHKDMNGALATFMGLGENKRYILRLFKDGRDVSLKESNFSQWDDSPYELPADNVGEMKISELLAENGTPGTRNPKPSMKKEENVTLSNSSNPEPSMQRPTEPKTFVTPDSATNIRESVVCASSQSCKTVMSPLATQETHGMENPRAPPQPKTSATKENGESAQNMREPARSAGDMAAKPVLEKIVPPNHTVPAAKPVPSAGPAKPVPIAGPAKQSSAAHLTNGSHAAAIKPNFDPSYTSARSTEASHDSSSRKKAAKNKARLCRDGINCRYLRKGPNVCRFVHPSDEIAAVHPMQPPHVVDIKPISKPEPKPPGLGLYVGPGQPKRHVEPPTCTFPSPLSAASSFPPEDDLSTFLFEHETCFKCSRDAFYRWLQSEDIASLEDLVEAITDDSYVDGDMVEAGLKKFKRKAFVNAVLAVTSRN